MKFTASTILLTISLSITTAFALEQSNKHASELIKNYDGSTTIVNPSYVQDGTRYPIFLSAKGVCSLFEFENYLSASAEDDELNAYKLAELNDDGTLLQFVNERVPFAKVTCYNHLSGNVSFAEELIKKPENVYQIIGPKLIRGDMALPIYYSATGACNLFGFSKSISAKDDSINSDKLAYLTDQGAFLKITKNAAAYTEITCSDPLPPLSPAVTPSKKTILYGYVADDSDITFFERLGFIVKQKEL